MQKKCLLVVVLLANIFLLYGCADDAARSQIADTNARLDKLQGNVGVIDSKVSDQKMIDILNKIANLQDQIDELNGKVSTLSNNQKTYQETQDQVNQSVQQQIDTSNTARNQKAVSSETLPVAASSKKSSSNPVIAGSGDLNSALKNIKNHNFPQAIKDLKNVIATSDDKETVQKALYYLTVTYAANTEYKNAVITGHKFVNDYPDSENVPDALRTVYISQKQLGMVKSAAKTAATLKQKYPDSNAAKKISQE